MAAPAPITTVKQTGPNRIVCPPSARSAWARVVALAIAILAFNAAPCPAQNRPAPTPSPATTGPGAPNPAAPNSAPADPAIQVRPQPAAGSAPTGSTDAPPPGSAPTAHAANAKARHIPTSPLEIAEALTMPFLASFIICSVIAVWFAIERLVVLRPGRVIPRPFVERFLQNLEQGSLEPQRALAVCEENGSPIAMIFAHGVRKWGKPSVEVEQAIIDGGERQVSQLRSHLRVLNAVATISPLLGLLGTVMGMIQCFNEIATSQAMGKADQLAGGIAVALLTTAVGLLIAIPSLTMYMYLSGRVDSLVMDMDSLAQDVVHLISAEAIADGSQLPKGRQRRAAPPPGEPKDRKAV